jgi:hypothetical protein
LSRKKLLPLVTRVRLGRLGLPYGVGINPEYHIDVHLEAAGNLDPVTDFS